MDFSHVASEQWYVIRAKTKQENRAEANLRSWGVETFLPRVRELSVDSLKYGNVFFLPQPTSEGYAVVPGGRTACRDTVLMPSSSRDTSERCWKAGRENIRCRTFRLSGRT